MNRPLVSIVIPTYERAGLLPRALQSTAAQSWPHLEIVVVDDGSTDHTAAVVQEFTRGCRRRTIYHYQDNAGCAQARNTGLKLANGDWILFLDSDDALEPDAIGALLEVARAEDADLVYSPAIEVYPDGRLWLNRPVAAGDPDALADKLFFDPNVRPGSVLLRIEAVRSLRGFESSLRYNEDTHFLMRAALRYRAAYLDTPTVRFYHHAGNKSRNRPAILRAMLRSICLLLKEFPGLDDRLEGRVARRIDQLRHALVRELLIHGEFDAAVEVGPDAAGLLDRVSMALHSTLPVRVAAWLRDRARRMAR